MRAAVLALALAGVGFALDARDYKAAYDLLRNGLCALRITCLLPADMLYPARWEEVEARLGQAREVLMIGDVRSLWPVISYLDGWLRTNDPARKQNRPQVLAVVPQEQMAWLAGWTQDPELARLVKVVASSDEDEPLSVVGRSGLPLVILDNREAYLPSWWQLEGPTLRQVLTWGRLLADQARAANERRREVR